MANRNSLSICLEQQLLRSSRTTYALVWRRRRRCDRWSHNAHGHLSRSRQHSTMSNKNNTLLHILILTRNEHHRSLQDRSLSPVSCLRVCSLCPTIRKLSGKRSWKYASFTVTSVCLQEKFPPPFWRYSTSQESNVITTYACKLLCVELQ